MINLQLNLPLYNVTISGEHETEVIKLAAFWCSLPTKCPKCQRPLTLGFRTPKGKNGQKFEYYELHCTGDVEVHSVNLGESIGTHDLYFDPKKSWYTYRAGDTPADVERRAEVADSATSTQTLPPAATPNSATPDPIVGRRNDLLKLINEAKKRNLRVGIVPADVKELAPEQLEQHITRLSNELLQAPTPAAQ
jgi:hypothetical protein